MIIIYGIFGTDGFGREVMPTAHAMLLNKYGKNGYNLIFVDKGPVKKETINGYKVVSEDEFIECSADKKYFNIAIADSSIRQEVANKTIAAGITPFHVMAQNTIIGDNNVIEAGAILCPFTSLTSNIKIGKFFHANIYSYVAHDCIIGDFVTFAPGVHCNGRVVVENNVYIGTGAFIKQGSEKNPVIIGEKAVVGMGAVVTKNVPPNTTVVGNPAVELKKKK